MATKSSSMALTARETASSWRRILPSPRRRSLSRMAGTGGVSVWTSDDHANSTQRPEPSRFGSSAGGYLHRESARHGAARLPHPPVEPEPAGEALELGRQLRRGVRRGAGLG